MTHPPSFKAPISVIVLGIHPTPDDPKVLAEILNTTPEALWLDVGMVALVRHETEIESVIYAEGLRAAAAARGVRMSLGVAGRDRITDPLTRVLDRARVAYDFALDLGGDLTVAHSTIISRPMRVAA